MSRGFAWSNVSLPPLPVGRLNSQTLMNIGIGRTTHFRAGPWVTLDEDGSRLLRVGSSLEPLLFPTAQARDRVEPEAVEPTVIDVTPDEPQEDGDAVPASEPAASRTVVFATPSAGRAQHRRAPRRPRPDRTARSG